MHADCLWRYPCCTDCGREVFVSNLTVSPEGSDPRIPVIAVDVDYLQLKGLNAAVRPANVDVLLHNVVKTDVNKELSVQDEK